MQESGKVYLDNAATTPMDPEVIDAMVVMMREKFGNPSSIHSFGREVRAAIENSRKTVARLLGVSPGEIFFTSGGTEADNMALQCGICDLGLKHAITSPIEHHAVLHTLDSLCQKGKVEVSHVRLQDNGHIDLQHLEELLASNPRSMVSLMHGNNELGNLLPLKKVGELCAKYDAIFHSDTVQTMGHYKMNLSELPVHFVTCGAHKFHGPKGVGFLYVNGDVKIKPLIHGGAQERNMRGGTENVYGIVGLAKAMEIAFSEMEEHQNHIQELKTYMISLLKAEIPGVSFNGDAEGSSLYTVLNVSFPPTPVSEMLLYKLDMAGIAASGGSACTSGSQTGSHVLTSLGTSPDRPAVRFSFSKYNTKAEIDYTMEVLKEIFVTEKA